jgi:tRNA threonylcarbamoyladenosine biosynthesis protein TsaE
MSEKIRSLMVKKIEDWQKVVEICQEMQATNIFLKGNLGAGKTTFVQYFMRNLGYDLEVTSPTFSLVNEYILVGGSRVYHMDLYRLADYDELYNAGIEEYFYAGEICIAEWPDLVMQAGIVDSGILIDIQLDAAMVRVVSLTQIGG